MHHGNIAAIFRSVICQFLQAAVVMNFSTFWEERVTFATKTLLYSSTSAQRDPQTEPGHITLASNSAEEEEKRHFKNISVFYLWILMAEVYILKVQ